MNQGSSILQTAEFNPKIKKYLLFYGALILALTIVGIVLIPIWLLIAPRFIDKYFDRLQCQLTTRSLSFQKGIIFHVERTIPLDKIQDLTFREGPLLKAFGLSIFKIETAGNTGQGGSDMTLIGIINAAEFRKKVFDQRDKVTDHSGSKESQESTIKILTEIRDSIARIEQKM
ncbi:PH domain-containing protein [Aliifodinibius salicampi]|uniref:PH domain-containing protein n=1 Tax=Fodinibius salicampi TaxID=1920655 RepID=A0ABT3PVV7_9BACT|nr:PH domain-containing protein [Fodinibius salicampi]MCW9711975.1 PH domain-containing protein [Fodinibius salicampi]